MFRGSRRHVWIYFSNLILSIACEMKLVLRREGQCVEGEENMTKACNCSQFDPCV